MGTEPQRQAGAVRDALPRKPGRDLEPVLERIDGELEPTEQVMSAVTGSWRHSRHCAVVLTSRRVIVGGGTVVHSYPLTSIHTAALKEGWRRAHLAVEMPGQVADVHGIHLDEAREMLRQIQLARKLLSHGA